ncbi:hypothetical protein V1522DRAFT_395471 [Lipomyces starkeyi]
MSTELPLPEQAASPINLTSNAVNAKDSIDGMDANTGLRKKVRTGCMTCRGRHHKCAANFTSDVNLTNGDEARPTCHNCKSRGLDCNWGSTLVFVESTKSRRVATDRLSPATSIRIRNCPSANVGPGIFGSQEIAIGLSTPGNVTSVKPTSNECDMGHALLSLDSTTQEHQLSDASEKRPLDELLRYKITSLGDSSSYPINLAVLAYNSSQPTRIDDVQVNAISTSSELSLDIGAVLNESASSMRSSISMAQAVNSDAAVASFDEYYGLHDMSREYMLTTARSMAPTRVLALHSYHKKMPVISITAPGLTPNKTALLLKNYIDEIAAWLDMFDNEGHFATMIPSLSLDCPALFYTLLGRHLEGCAALFAAAGIHGFSGDLEQTLFWCFARMDLSSAVIDSFRGEGSLDMYANYAVFLCSKVMELISATSNSERKCDCETEWQELWQEVREWEELRPTDMLPLLSFDADGGEPFPTVLYATSPAIDYIA